MKLTTEQKFRILVNTTGQYFTRYIPEKWESMSVDEKDHWLKVNTWEVFESYTTDQTWGWCETAANSTVYLIESGELL